MRITKSQVETWLNNWHVEKFKRFVRIRAGIDHINLRIWTDEGKYVMTFFHKEESEQLTDVCCVLEYLTKNKFPTIHFIKTKSDQYSLRLPDFSISLSKHLTGKSPQRPVSTNVIKECASNLGYLDKLLQKYPKTFGKTWINFKDGEKTLNLMNINSEELYDKIYPLYLELKDKLKILSKCRISLVHGDYSLSNVLLKNNKISGVLDFSDMHEDYLVWDLAVSMAHFCTNKGKVLYGSIRPSVDSYQKNITLNKCEKSALYWLILTRSFHVIVHFWESLYQQKRKEIVPNKVQHSLIDWGLTTADSWKKLGYEKFYDLAFK